MNANQPRPMIILPSETQSREFDAKLLLACMLAERGLPTIVGSRIAIHNHMHKLDPAIYVAKDFRKPSSRIFKILEGLGASIVAWDEEGLLFFDEQSYYQQRVHAKNLAQVKEFFAWGPLNARITALAPGYHDQLIHLFGNPRIDLLRPELRSIYAREVAELRQRYGKFILINSNFGILNHYLPTHVAKPGGKDRLTGKTATPSTDAKLVHLGLLFEAFKAMLVPLAQKFPQHTILVRPHPSESLEAWREAARGQKNVVVIHEGPVQPWLLACDAMVHSSCTTGIEGYLLGTRVISYRPVQSDTFDHKVSNDLSFQVFSLEDMLKAVADTLQGDELDQGKLVRDQIANELFASLTGELASDKIASRIAECTEAEGFLQPTNFFAQKIAKLHSASRSAYRLITTRIPNHKNSAAYSHKRFPGVSLAYVEQRVTDYQHALNRFEKISVRKITENIFVIE